jgi:hypothetical protein
MVWAMQRSKGFCGSFEAPFEITKFESPAQMVPQHIPSVELSLNQDHLVLTVEQVPGSIWVLDNLAP